MQLCVCERETCLSLSLSLSLSLCPFEHLPIKYSRYLIDCMLFTLCINVTWSSGMCCYNLHNIFFKPMTAFQHTHKKDIETVVNVERGKKLSDQLRA